MNRRRSRKTCCYNPSSWPTISSSTTTIKQLQWQQHPCRHCLQRLALPNSLVEQRLLLLLSVVPWNGRRGQLLLLLLLQPACLLDRH